nr:hypothetical protein [Tanacetum cinerariifolium]
MGKTVNEFRAMLKFYEQTLPKNNAPALNAIRAGKVQKGNKHKKLQSQMPAMGQNYGKGKNKQAYALKPKIPPPPKREDLANNSICHECELVVQGLRASRKLKSRAFSLHVGNGQYEAVAAIGVFNLCLSSGLEIVLNNCHYAPSITIGVISVSRLYEDGFVNLFMNNTIQQQKSQARLGPALLWHCCLGHISKKRIEKLQHDGLLDSSDLMAFEKCVACMSGKMARKPYTHQVERAKDLLGLIHTDVCSPFKIMSRQGASYFVTFTDDFSRYGYVYLLKHKYEVFKTFKVFQKEVENQLGKTIKSLRFDRGGEYMSQEFLDHLKDHGIIAHRTPPYTPQHNASGSLEDLEIIQEEDMHHSIDTSLNHKEDDLEIDEQQSDIVPIRRSTKTRYAPDRMCLYIDAEEHEKDNEVWVLVELPPNGKTVGSKWLFKKKTNMNGNVHTYKARLVAKGYTQTLGIDYEETFSLVVDIRAIRILIAIAAYYDYEIWQMDVKIVFLNGYLSEEEKLKLSKSQGASTPAELKRMQNVPYASVVGSIMYAVRCTHPDVAFTQNTGYVFVLNGGAVDWKSAKQSIFATSSAKAEYIAAFDASKEVVWVRKFIYGLGVVPTIKKPISMYCDNTGAITIANESGITKGARHFCTKVHYLHEVIEYGDIKLEKVHTDDNLADPFTKALAFPKHSEDTRNIGMLPASQRDAEEDVEKRVDSSSSDYKDETDYDDSSSYGSTPYGSHEETLLLKRKIQVMILRVIILIVGLTTRSLILKRMRLAKNGFHLMMKMKSLQRKSGSLIVKRIAQTKNFFKDAGKVVDVRLQALKLNGKDLMGHSVRLKLARERGALGPGSRNEKPYRKGQGTVFVRGLIPREVLAMLRMPLKSILETIERLREPSYQEIVSLGILDGLSMFPFI